MKPRLRVLVAEDSPVQRELLVLLLESDPAIEVVAAVRDGAEAVERTESLRPDVVLMDVHMPRLNGYSATRLIMARVPVPIVLVSATVDAAEMETSFEALAAGAVALLPKPAGPGHPEHEATASRLVQTVKSMAEVPVVRRWASRRAPEPGPLATGGPRPVQVVAIGASTGGPQVLAQLMRELPSTIAAPIIVVQHIAPGFVGGLAEWLTRMTTLRVQVATAGDPIRPRTVYLAPEGAHLELDRRRALVLTPPAPGDGFAPSVDRLFVSVAAVYGAEAAGVLLTGMGRDGANGLLRLRQVGAVTIAQDEASSIVFGMPGEAVRLGAAEWVLAPDQISRAIAALAVAPEKGSWRNGSS
jgi:two-component system chemotaxis response regulator CheB